MQTKTGCSHCGLPRGFRCFYTRLYLVSAYVALGLASNDPNTVPDAAFNTIMDGVSIYSSDFFTKAVANLAGIDINSTGSEELIIASFMNVANLAGIDINSIEFP